VPRLGAVARTEIARAIGVFRVYARQIFRGKVPHPRHFEALAELAGTEIPIRAGESAKNRGATQTSVMESRPSCVA
jgi:hypothetical protein